MPITQTTPKFTIFLLPPLSCLPKTINIITRISTQAISPNKDLFTLGFISFIYIKLKHSSNPPYYRDAYNTQHRKESAQIPPYKR